MTFLLLLLITRLVPLEFLSTHGTLPLGRILLYPLHNTMHVEVMATFPRQEAAVVAGIFAGGTGAIKVNLADTTDIVFRKIPPPSGNGIPILDLDFHGYRRYRTQILKGVLFIKEARIELDVG